jgi:hypothetical protein
VKPGHVLIAAAGLLVLVALASPLWADKPEGIRSLAEQLWRAEELMRRRDAAHRTSAAKESVAAELIAGRLTLRQAAEEFRQLHARLSDEDSGPILRTYRGTSDEESLYLNVLAWAGYPFRYDPGRDRSLDPALDRLRQEYRDLFGSEPGDRLLPRTGAARPPRVG